MPTVPINIRVEILAWNIVFQGKVGFTVNKPLPATIVEDAIGIMDVVVYRVFETTVYINLAGKGKHYAVLGIDYGGGIIPLVTASYKLQMQLLGQTAELVKTNVSSTEKRYLAVILEVDENGAVSYRGQADVAPGQSPIIDGSGGGGFFGGDIGGTMAEIAGMLIQMMLPLMMVNLMINMVTGLMQSMTQVVV